MSIMVGVGRGAQHGVLIRDAEALERMEKVDTLVVDKTGTLTEGRPKVVHIEPAAGFRRSDVCRSSRAWNGPANTRWRWRSWRRRRSASCSFPRSTDFDSPVGKGVVGKSGGLALVSGAAKFLAEHGIDVTPLNAAAEQQRAKSATVIFVAWTASWPASWPSQTPSSRRRRRLSRAARGWCANRDAHRRRQDDR